jgi:hypothetical protein
MSQQLEGPAQSMSLAGHVWFSASSQPVTKRTRSGALGTKPHVQPCARTYLNSRYTEMVTVKHSLSAACCMLGHEAPSSLAMLHLHFTPHAKIGTKELHMR